MRRFLVITVVVIGTVVASSPHAAATTQTVSSFDVTFYGTDQGICGFPISATDHLTGTRIRFFDDTGALVQARYSVTEQDIFSANGKSLTSEPYHFSLQIGYDNGEVTSFVTYGLAGEFLLPDGTLFLSAGFTDFIEQGTDFSLTPNYGLTGDIDALCAALSA